MLTKKMYYIIENFSELHSKLIRIIGSIVQIRSGDTKITGKLLAIVDSRENDDLGLAVAIEGIDGMLAVDESSAIAHFGENELFVLFDSNELFTEGEFI